MKYFHYILILFLLIFCSCHEQNDGKNWIMTSNGLYFYGESPKNKSEYTWDGPSKGFLIDGNGTLSVFSENGKYSNKAEVYSYYGSISKSDWKNLSCGLFLGNVKDNKPTGFGVLKDSQLIKCGTFSNGVLDDSLCYIFYTKNGKLKYKGKLDDGKYDGMGILCEENGDTLYYGYFKDGIYSKNGKLYKRGKLSYCGEFEKGIPNGFGKSYAFDGSLKYEGDWENGKYNGNGTLFSNGAVIYKGEWKDGLYDGDGILYVNGEARKGNWSNGHENIPIKEQIKHVFNIITNKKESKTKSSNIKKYGNSDVFLDSMSVQFANYVDDKILDNVEDRFGFYDAVVRIPIQIIFVSQEKRMDYANEKLTKGITSEDLQEWINGKIYDYNKKVSKDEQLNTISLKPFKKHEMVDDAVFSQVIDRENIEYSDTLAEKIICGIIWILINIVCFFFGISAPGPGTVCAIVIEIIQTVVIFVVLYFLIDIHMPELEQKISSGIRQNYVEYISNQEITNQVYEK